MTSSKLDLSEWEHVVVKNGELDQAATQVFADWLEEHGDPTSKGWREIAKENLFPYGGSKTWWWYTADMLTTFNQRDNLISPKDADHLLHATKWGGRSEFNDYNSPFAALCDLAQALSQ